MADYQITFFDPINNASFPMDFADLIAVIKGSSIRSAAIASDFFELGLTDGFNLRMQNQPDILLMSTVNKGENPPVRLQIIEEGDAPTAAAVERRIHSLRQVYATTFLVNAGRSEEIVRSLEADPKADLEVLLDEKDRLYITAASEGTFWLTVIAKTRVAFRSLATIVPLFYVEGRQALLDRMRANTALRKLAVDEMETRLAYDKANKLVGLVQKIEKIKDPIMREKVRDALSSSMGGLGKQLPSLPRPTNKRTKTLPNKNRSR